MADIIPFKSQFELDCEQAVSVALFGNDASPQMRRQGLGLRPQAMPGDSFKLDDTPTVDLRNALDDAP